MNLKFVLCVVGSINLAFSTPCLDDSDFNGEMEWASMQKCSSLPNYNVFNCSKTFKYFFSKAPCCNGGRVKCSDEILTPCANIQEYQPRNKVPADGTSECYDKMADALTSMMGDAGTMVDCSNLTHVKFLISTVSCCTGSLQCQTKEASTTPCVSDYDFTPELQPDVRYPTCGTMWSMLEQSQTVKKCSNEMFRDAVSEVSKCCGDKAWKCHNGSWTAPDPERPNGLPGAWTEPEKADVQEAEESEDLLKEDWQLVLLMCIVFAITSIVMYLKLAGSNKNSPVPSSEHKALSSEKNTL